MLEDQIKMNIRDAPALEELYQKNPAAFRSAIEILQNELKDEPALEFWSARLTGKSPGLSWGKRSDWKLLLLMALGFGVFLNLPEIAGFSRSDHAPRNMSFALLIPAGIYLLSQSALNRTTVRLYLSMIAIVFIWINAIPGSMDHNDTLVLATLHLPILLWTGMSYLFSKGRLKNHEAILDFLQINASWFVLSGLLFLSGGLFLAVTTGLFSFSGFEIGGRYADNTILFALPAIPAIAWLLVRENPDLIRQVPVIIARVLSPLALIALLAYLPALLFGNKSPYEDRNFLLILNFVLIAVLALIFFSYQEFSKQRNFKTGQAILLGLALFSLIIDGIAFSAILHRTISFGFTVNRITLLGGNFLIFIHLLRVGKELLSEFYGNKEPTETGSAVADFLPVYGIWAAVVVFLFPVIFRFL